MKLILLGATGNTGLQLAEQACKRGHEVTALVRNPDKIAHITDKNLKVIKCNLLDVNELKTHFAGHDAILSSLGSPGLTLSRITFSLDSMKVIVQAMRDTNIKRILIVSSQYTKPSLPSYPSFLYKFILRPMIGRQLDALYDMEEYLLNECKDNIDFTIVRPPRLTDDALSATKEVVVEDKYHFEDNTSAARISRANVARFMLDILDSNQYLKKGVSIDMPKA